jgi:transcriptional regulator with XRE-family HTH domain
VDAVETWAEVGERVAEARRAAELSQGELAERLGLDRSPRAHRER